LLFPDKVQIYFNCLSTQLERANIGIWFVKDVVIQQHNSGLGSLFSLGF